MTLALVAASRDVHPGVREVQDPDFWGLPLHTPLTPAIKAAQKAKGFGGGPATQARKAARGAPAARPAQSGTSVSTVQRVRNWFTAPDMSPDAQKVVDGFDPRTFESDQQAGQYALGHSSPGRFESGGSRMVGERAPHWSMQDKVSIVSDSIPGFHEAQTAIRKGDTDNPQAKAFTARFQRNSTETTDDLLVSRRVAPDAFPGGVEGLTGKEVHDAAYFQGNLGTPIGDAPVLLTVAVPKGTRAMFTGNGPNDRGVILDRDQRLRITKVTPDGKGGWYVAAVAVPKTGAPAGELKEGTAAPGTKATRGGPGAPPLLEREAGKRAPGFAQPRGFDEPPTRAAPPTESGRPRTPTEINEEAPTIRQTKRLPADTVAELNDPKTTISRYRDIAREADIKVPARIIKKADIRDFLLGKKGAPPARARGLRVETPEVETRKLSPEAIGQLNEPKTTVAQLRKIAKDHGIKVPSTATRKADIRAHLMQAGGVKENPPDMLPESERTRFRAGWREVSKAPEGLAQAELNEIFLDVHGGRLGVIDAARRLENSAGIDREERDRLRVRRGDGEPGAEERKLDDEIAAKEKAAKFLRDYRLTEEAPVPAPVKKAAKKAAPRKAVVKKAAPSEKIRSETHPDGERVFLGDTFIGTVTTYRQPTYRETGEGHGVRADIRVPTGRYQTRYGAVMADGRALHIPDAYSAVQASRKLLLAHEQGTPYPRMSSDAENAVVSKKATSSAGTPRAVPRLSRDELEKFNEGQLRVMARNSGVDIPEDATRAEIIDALASKPTSAKAPAPRTVRQIAGEHDILDDWATMPASQARSDANASLRNSEDLNRIAERLREEADSLESEESPDMTRGISRSEDDIREARDTDVRNLRRLADAIEQEGTLGPRLEKWEVYDALKSNDPAQWARAAEVIGVHPRFLESKNARERYAVFYVNEPRPGARTYQLRHGGIEGMTGGEIYNALVSDDPEQWKRAAKAIGIHPRALTAKRTRERYAVYYINEPGAGQPNPPSIPDAEDPFPTLTEDQLRNIAQARGIHVPASATKAEIARLISRGGGEMTGSGAVATPHSTVQVRPALAQATGPRTLARATQAEYKRITGRDLAIDFGTDPDMSMPTAQEHMEGVLRAAEQWPDVDLREVRWFNGELSEPGKQRPWAISANGAIMFNTAYTSKANRERYLGELADGVAGWDNGGTGFHPRGAATPSAVAMHEFGHLIAPERAARNYPGVLRLVQRRAKEDRVPPSRLIRREVSRYADTNPSELVAEAVLDVLINGDAAGQLARQIVELLRTGRL